MIVFILCISPLIAQNFSECGTGHPSSELGGAYLDQVAAIQAYSAANPDFAPKQVPVNFYVFRKDDGSGYTTSVDAAEIALGIDNLNNIFGPYEFEFFQCGPPTYIDNTILYEKARADLPLTDFGFSSSSVNIILVPYNPSTNGISYAEYPCFAETTTLCAPTIPDNYMVLTANVHENINVKLTQEIIIHEAGHIFGLLHTWHPSATYTWPVDPSQLDHPYNGFINGGWPRELVLRGTDNTKDFEDENCEEAGDLVCDTPVDGVAVDWAHLNWPDPNNTSCPGPNNIPSSDPLDILNCTVGLEYDVFNCELVGDYVDYNGDPITNQPSGIAGRNIMSYHTSSCRTIITPGQGTRMSFYYDNYRQAQYVPVCGNLIDEVDYWDTDEGLEDIVIRYNHPVSDQRCNTFTNNDGDFEGVLHDDLLKAEILKIGSDPDLGYLREDWSDGISVLDLVLIQRHILGITPLENGYAKIAADVDDSGTINSFDLIEIQKLLLWYTNSFPAFEQPWRFVPEYIPNDYPFTFHNDPYNMTIDGDNYVNTIPYLDKDWEYTLSDGTNGVSGFDALKVGDVSGNSVPGGSPPMGAACTAPVNFLVQPKILSPDVDIEVEVKAYGFNNVAGFQTGINLPYSDYELIDVEGISLSGLTAENNVGLTGLEDDQLKILWYNAQPLSFPDGTPLFKLVLKPKNTVNLSGTLAKDDLALENVFYELSGCQVPVDLEFIAYSAEERNSEADGVTIREKENKLQCFPNPVSREATVAIDLTRDTKGVFEIYNSLGALMSAEVLTTVKGRNTYFINFSSYPTGVYWLNFKNDKGLNLGQRIIVK